MTTEQYDQIIPADEKLKKQLMIGMLLFTVIGGFLIYFMSAYLEECKILAESDMELAVAKVKNFLFFVTIANALFSSGFSVYFISVAIKILKSERYPPEGMSVIKDTTLRTGKKAKGIAIAHIFMAIILLSSNILMWYIHVIIDTLTIK